jgi:hypothetical protein
MDNTIPLQSVGYYRYRKEAPAYDADLEPYASLFLKPLTNKKCAFSKHDLEVMCKDPLHSRRLILYLINFVQHM